MSRSKILFFLSGSVAAYKAAHVVSRLVQAGHEVQCVATESALRFVGAATFEGLTGKKVLIDLWESGHAMDHIHLSRWADLGVVCPASANTLAKLALGLASDMVSATLLAWPKGKPLMIFPAMNAEMLASDPVQSHLRVLRERGFLIGESEEGFLACGEVGAGRLMEPDEILRRIQEKLHSRPALGSILITSGATRESLDGIRFITNQSTGQTGAELSEALRDLGWSVTCLHGQGATTPKGVRLLSYTSHADLESRLREELRNSRYSAVIHCAAVSDYTVVSINGVRPDERIKMSSGENLTVELKPTSKILPRLKSFSSNPDLIVIGFKLTLNAESDELLRAAHRILDANVDAVVANDWNQVRADRSRHPGVVCQKGGARDFTTVSELARLLDSLIREGWKRVFLPEKEFT